MDGQRRRVRKKARNRQPLRKGRQLTMSLKPVQTTETAKRQSNAKAASVTVVMPIRNEESHVERTLQQVLGQRRKGIDLEVLVVDGRSTDRTQELVQSVAAKHPEIRLLDNPKRLSSAARNVAIRHARGEYLVIIDGHCEIPSRSYFVDLVDAFQASGADCLGRPQPLDVTAASLLQRAVAAARASCLGHHPDSFIYTDSLQEAPALSVAIAYRGSVFKSVGLFDERFDACEDCELNYRVDQAGLRCVIDPRLTVRYQPRNSLAGLFRQLARYGRGRVRLARKHPASSSWKVLLPALLVLGVLAGPLVWYFVPLLWWFYLAAVGGYVATVVMTSIALAWRRRQPGLLTCLPLVFVVIHLGAGAGVLWELITGSSARVQTDASGIPAPAREILAKERP